VSGWCGATNGQESAIIVFFVSLCYSHCVCMHWTAKHVTLSVVFDFKEEMAELVWGFYTRSKVSFCHLSYSTVVLYIGRIMEVRDF